MAATAAKPAAKKAAARNGKVTGPASASRMIGVQVIARDKLIVEDGFNPRTTMEETELAELVDSIRARGVLQALTVAAMPNGQFKLLGGHRRVAAGDVLGIGEYPAVIRESEKDAQLIDAIVDNKLRVDLNPVEEAEAYGRLINQHGLTVKGAAEAAGVAQRLVTERLRLLDVPLVAREYFADGRLGTSAVAGMAAIAAKLPAVCSEIAMAAFTETNSWDDWRQHIDRRMLERKGGWYDALVKYASCHPGVIAVTGHKEPGGGWSLKGSQHWFHSRHSAVDARSLQGLSKEAKDRVNAMGSQPEYREYKYVVAFGQSDVDALDAAGVLIRDPDDKTDGVCHDMKMLAALAEPIIERDHRDWTKAKAAIARRAASAPGGGDSETERADQLARDYATSQTAHEFNLKLGEQLTRHFGSVELTMDSAQLLCRMLLEEVELSTLAATGLRYVLPQWQQEITQKNGKRRLRVKGDGTKAPKGTDGTNADGDLVSAFFEWWELATTPQEVLGRTVIALAAARFAKQDAIPKSRHAYWHWPTSWSSGGPRDYKGKAVQRLDAMVKPKLPAAKRPAARKPAKATSNGKGSATRGKTALELIKSKPGITIPELAEAMALKQNYLYRLLPGLQKDGLVRKEGRGWHPGSAVAS